MTEEQKEALVALSQELKQVSAGILPVVSASELPEDGGEALSQILMASDTATDRVALVLATVEEIVAESAGFAADGTLTIALDGAIFPVGAFEANQEAVLRRLNEKYIATRSVDALEIRRKGKEPVVVVADEALPSEAAKEPAVDLVEAAEKLAEDEKASMAKLTREIKAKETEVKAKQTEIERLKRRLAALETENAQLKSGGASADRKPIMGSVGAEPKVEFDYVDDISKEALSSRVNDGWEIHTLQVLTPDMDSYALPRVFVVLKKTVGQRPAVYGTALVSQTAKLPNGGMAMKPLGELVQQQAQVYGQRIGR